MAGLGALVGGEVLRAEALLSLFDQGRGFWVAVVMFGGVAFGGNADSVTVGVHGEGVIERDRDEREVDGHGGRSSVLVCCSG